MNIYKITNVLNNKVYIGQTKNSPEHRFNQHIREARSNKKKNYGIFHDAILQYGSDYFTVELIEVVEDKDIADERERFWISKFRSDQPEYGYNCDSGGLGGGEKNNITKSKIGKTTLDKWNDPDKAARMLEGLRKGTETVKKNIVRIPYTCPMCGETKYIEPYLANNKKFCSLQCATDSGSWEKGVKISAEKNHKRNLERKKIIKESIIKWCEDNKELVMNCPKNSISKTLSELKQMLLNEYSINDWRSVYICFDVKNLKSLLAAIQNNITANENVR